LTELVKKCEGMGMRAIKRKQIRKENTTEKNRHIRHEG
jgi:hypothetical protein